MTIEEAAGRIIARWPTWSHDGIRNSGVVCFVNPELLLNCAIWKGRGYCVTEKRHRDGWFARFGVECGDGVADGGCSAEQWHPDGPCEAIITAARQARSALAGAIADIDAKVLHAPTDRTP